MTKYETKTLSGVKVEHYKNTGESATAVMPVPDKVSIPLIQHMGAPCTPLVKAGDPVKVGQKIADCEKAFSAPIHASVSGKVTGFEDFINPAGIRTQCIVIESDGLQTQDESISPPKVHNTAEFIRAVRASGLVGLGGAGFPTHMKLNLKNPEKVDTLIVNIAECEPYITSDYRNCMEDGQDIVDGIEYVRKYVGNIQNVYIGIEDNKPKAIELLTNLTRDKKGITIFPMKSQYPKGAEKVLIYGATGRVVGDGMIPADVGVVVMNGTSVAFVSKYMKTGMPLVSKRLTVDGSAVAKPQNVLVPIGARFVDVIAFCGGYREEPKKMLMGGPMMGIAVFDDTYPVLKNNNAVLCFGSHEAQDLFETPCIRCGRCIRTCPFGLMPTEIDRALRLKDAQGLADLHVMRCMECGCCAYACPAKRSLVLTNRMAKKFLRENSKQR